MGKNVYSSEVKWAVVKDKLSGKFGSVDAIVNNAGLMPLSHLHKNQQDEWNTMVDVNIKGVLHGIGAVLPYMREQKSGHVINISSVAGHEVMLSSAVYSGTNSRCAPSRKVFVRKNRSTITSVQQSSHRERSIRN